MSQQLPGLTPDATRELPSTLRAVQHTRSRHGGVSIYRTRREPGGRHAQPATTTSATAETFH
jgi:hypothetical protein